jgi:hypothetical protein
MTVERFIAFYDKDSDSLSDEVQIMLSAAEIIAIMGIDPEDDPDAYKPYTVNAGQFAKFRALVPELGNFDFEAFVVHLECFSIE